MCARARMYVLHVLTGATMFVEDRGQTQLPFFWCLPLYFFETQALTGLEHTKPAKLDGKELLGIHSFFSSVLGL